MKLTTIQAILAAYEEGKDSARLSDTLSRDREQRSRVDELEAEVERLQSENMEMGEQLQECIRLHAEENMAHRLLKDEMRRMQATGVGVEPDPHAVNIGALRQTAKQQAT